MSDAPSVGRLFVHPIKSLDRVAVSEAVVFPGGGLQHDREFALFDSNGRWINGKRDPRIHLIRSEYDLPRLIVTLKSSEGLSHSRFIS